METAHHVVAFLRCVLRPAPRSPLLAPSALHAFQCPVFAGGDWRFPNKQTIRIIDYLYSNGYIPLIIDSLIIMGIDSKVAGKC